MKDGTKQLVPRGYACLTFNLRGHARTRRQFERVTRVQNLRDVLGAYDFLVGQPGVAAERIGLVGSSYGGYLAVLLTAERMVRWLALRAPAIYKDADFAASRFAGDVLVVESEHDTVIPHQVVENYLRAFAVAARSVTHSVLRGADHGLSRTSSRKAYGKILEDWFRTSGDTWAEVGSHQAMNRSRSMER